MKKSFISVVMSTYNHADYVIKAMNSVLNQKDVAFEFLIADDGSKDDTCQKIRSIQDDKILFEAHPVNRGACVVTNELIMKAKGEYIAIINSDDCWSTPYKLANQLAFMNDNPHVGACFGKAQFVDARDQAIAHESLSFGSVFDQHNRSQGAWLRRFFEIGNCLCHPTVLIRKQCYEEVGFYDNRLRQLPDLDMWIRLVKKYDIHILDQKLINFRIAPGLNTSEQNEVNSSRTINEHFLIADCFFEGITQKQLLDGFSDMLVHSDFKFKESIDIEKVLLYFYEGYDASIKKAYHLFGVLKLHALLAKHEYRTILQEQYAVNDLWFQDQTGCLDVLKFKPSSPKKQYYFRKIKKYINQFLNLINIKS